MKSKRSLWLAGAIGVVALVVIAAGPVFQAGNHQTDSLFASGPDPEELQQLGTFGVAAAAPAPAAQGANSPESIIGSKVSGLSSGDILGLLWRLALVGAIIWASIFVLRKFVNRSGRSQSSTGALKVLETIGLASNRLVYLLEAGDRVLVVGTTQNHMALLAELTDPEVVSALRQGADRASPRIATLGDMMRGFGKSAVERISVATAAGRGRAQPRVALATGEITPILEHLLETQAAIARESERLQPVAAAPTPARTEAE